MIKRLNMQLNNHCLNTCDSRGSQDGCHHRPLLVAAAALLDASGGAGGDLARGLFFEVDIEATPNQIQSHLGGSK